MKFDFTDGEWEYRENIDIESDNEKYYDVVSNNGADFCCKVIAAEVSGKANARLIAHAPKILKALVEIYRICRESNFMFGDLVETTSFCGHKQSRIIKNKYEELIEEATGKKWGEA